jgi:hypothetical protein
MSILTGWNRLILRRNLDTICCERRRGRRESKLEGFKESLRGPWTVGRWSLVYHQFLIQGYCLYGRLHPKFFT